MEKRRSRWPRRRRVGAASSGAEALAPFAVAPVPPGFGSITGAAFAATLRGAPPLGSCIFVVDGTFGVVSAPELGAADDEVVLARSSVISPRICSIAVRCSAMPSASRSSVPRSCAKISACSICKASTEGSASEDAPPAEPGDRYGIASAGSVGPRQLVAASQIVPHHAGQ